MQEKRLLSYILDKDVTNENIWYKGNAFYVFNGKLKRIPYVDFFKNKEYLKFYEQLKNDISYDDAVFNIDRLLKANENHITTLIFEAVN